MEPVSAVFGIMAALPQAIQSAKELYDLRSRYKDASVLITAIYSESMVIAASLSQVQNLLYHDALQSKPQLLQTFDRALTGCRVVYGCLEEEVRDLVAKAEADDLKFKDRARFLWKEDTFKELLTQIRGQQSALSLLIQGLQMESIGDIRKLVEENSVTLDQVVKRSRTLRQSHPRVHVPESLFSSTQSHEDVADAESIFKSTEFAFDDEVINSKAYRRAMRLYTTRTEPIPHSTATTDCGRDSPPAYESSSVIPDHNKDISLSDNAADPPNGSDDTRSSAEEARITSYEATEDPTTHDHQESFDSIEKNYLPYMPRITSTAPLLSSLRANTSSGTATQTDDADMYTPPRSFSEGNVQMVDEQAPPLPPRRPSGPQLLSKLKIPESEAGTTASSDSIDTSLASSGLTSISATSSRTTYESLDQKHIVSRKPLRKPLPLRHHISSDILGMVRSRPSTLDSPSPVSSLQNAQMHDIWLSIVEAEREFVERMFKLRKMFYDNVLQQWPLLEKHIDAVLVGERLAALNKSSLLQAMEQQVSQAEGAICDSTIFEQWANQAHKLYHEYCQGMPHTVSSLRTTQGRDPKFGPFVNTLGLSLAWFGKGWEDYLKLPIVQLGLYIEKLQSLVYVAEALDEPAAYNEANQLRTAVAALQWLEANTSPVLQNAQDREEIQNLEKRIHTLNSDYFSQLRLLDSDRRVKYQSSMAIKLKSQGPWQAVHVMLLDNFLLWGKVKPQKKGKGDRILVLDAPIAINDMEVSTPCEDHQFLKATLFDDIPRGSVLYIITVKNKTDKARSHMLGAFGYQERKAWLEHFTAVTTLQTGT